MLGTLLESRARRQRRNGGMALSIVVHLAIITASVAGTTIAKPAPKHREPVIVIVPPQPKTPEPKAVRPVRRESQTSNPTTSTLVIKQIDVPTKIPIGIPDIDIRGAVTPDSIVIGGGPGTKTGGIGRSLIGGDDPVPSNEWRGNDAYMNLIKTATPRYPESLRQAGVDGRVLIRFTVDTLGRIEPSSVQVLSETHPLFSRAVRDVISQFRFRSAESNGKKVPALAEMPFEFSITKR
jgi:periplasmic protein TonB